jgi:hypothetical protein
MDRYERRVLVIVAVIFSLSVFSMLKATDFSFSDPLQVERMPLLDGFQADLR